MSSECHNDEDIEESVVANDHTSVFGSIQWGQNLTKEAPECGQVVEAVPVTEEAGDHWSAKIDAVSLNIPALDFDSAGREGVRQGVNETVKVVNGWIGLELDESGTKGLQTVYQCSQGLRKALLSRNV